MPDCQALVHFDIPNPVSDEFIEPPKTDISARNKTIISVGRIGQRKNTLGILRIVEAQMKRDQDLRLILCGRADSRSYLEECKKFVEDHDLEGRVDWSGNLTSRDLIAALDKSSCLILTSKQESAPVAIAEAHARGTPVIAPKRFGIPYMIEEGENGFFLPDSDIDMQAAVIARALDHSWDHSSIARTAAQRYNVYEICNQTLKAYRHVLDRSARD